MSGLMSEATRARFVAAIVALAPAVMLLGLLLRLPPGTL